MKVRTIGAWVLIGSLLLDNVFLPFDIGFEFRLQYIIFIFAIPLYLLAFRVKANLKTLIFIFLVSLFLLITPLLSGTYLIGSSRQLLLIFICSVPFYLMANSYNYNATSLFKIYLSASLLISIISLIQFLSFVIHFKAGYDFSYLGFDMSRLDPPTYRVQGWMMEPSFLAYFLLPAAFFAIVKFFKAYDSEIKFARVSCFVILISLLLTQSLIAYVGILLVVFIIIFEKYSFLKRPSSLLFLSVFLVFLSIGLYNVPLIKLKLDDTIDLFSGKVHDYQSVNLSSFHIYNNAMVTARATERNPLVGIGFGNFHVAYQEYAMPVNDNSSDLKPDGSSLLLRLITETGLPFAFFFLWLVFRFRLRKTLPGKFNDEWLINNGVFVLILMRLIRMGHYTVLGLPFFLIIYYLTYQNQKKMNFLEMKK